MKALVTGATGLIGAHIVRTLLDRGYEVCALLRHAGRQDALAGLPVTCFVGDLLDPGDHLDEACAGCDVVFHTAAQFAYGAVDTAGLRKTAVAGTEALLHACARADVRRTVVTSSSVVFGFSDSGERIDETAPLAGSAGEPFYVGAKIAQHRRALELARHLRLDVRLACPTMTLGPTSARLGPSNGLIVAYLADPFACTFPGGCNLVAATDVAIGHLLIAQRGTPGESYLLGSENLSWREIHRTVAELTGVAPPRIELNHTLTFLAAAAQELTGAVRGQPALSTREQAAMAGRYYWYSHAKAARIGYDPTPARDALIETISWLAASPHITREMRAHMHLAADIHCFRAASRRSNVA
jgi:dihydroflavonol-4-reductase